MLKLLRQLLVLTNLPILAAVVLLSAMGAITIWADDPDEGLRQLVFMGIATACMLGIQLFDYRRWGQYAIGFYVVGLLLVGYTLLPFLHVGRFDQRPFMVPYRGGAYNWINMVKFSIQPSELLKVGFVLVLARYLRFRSNYRTLRGLVAPFTLATIPILFILKQPDLGTALVFIPTLFAMLFAAGARIKHLFGVVGMGLLVIPLIWFSGNKGTPIMEHLPSLVQKYQRNRVYNMFRDDELSKSAGNLQIWRAMTAMGSGGFTGKGLGEIPAGDRVPEKRNDMIFALIGEQWGWLGCALVILCYLAMFFGGLEMAGATREPFGRLVAIGVVTMLAGQTFLNLMVVMKLFPVTGVTLPLVSSGGSSLIATFLFVGLLLNIGQRRPIVMANRAFEFDD